LTGHYFDTAYLAKCYLNEPDAAAVREVARVSPALYISSFSIAELACVFLRRVREGALREDDAAKLRAAFLEDVRNEVWLLLPVNENLFRKVEFVTRTLPHEVFLRAGDAIHIVSAVDAGLDEIWTNDRHLLAAAAHFGLKGRSVR
jgi:predicted nucleic acid-binding protein